MIDMHYSFIFLGGYNLECLSCQKTFRKMQYKLFTLIGDAKQQTTSTLKTSLIWYILTTVMIE